MYVVIGRVQKLEFISFFETCIELSMNLSKTVQFCGGLIKLKNEKTEKKKKMKKNEEIKI